MGPVQGIRFNSGLPDFANRFELPQELPKPILITEEEAQQKLRELGVCVLVLFYSSTNLSFSLSHWRDARIVSTPITSFVGLLEAPLVMHALAEL